MTRAHVEYSQSGSLGMQVMQFSFYFIFLKLMRYHVDAVTLAVSVNLARTSRAVLDTAEKLAQMTVSGRQQVRPPQMKAGGWHGHSDFLSRSHEIPSARNYS